MALSACPVHYPFILLLLFTSLQSEPILVDYNISLYSDKLQMSSLIWLAPADCFYEAWVQQTPYPSQADRSTSSIVVEVDPSDVNGTLYHTQSSYEIPRCNPLFREPPAVNNFVYQVGPYLESMEDASIISVEAGKYYRVRYCLVSGTQMLAFTNWSTPFQTRVIPVSGNDLPVWLIGRSGGMVVITVILSLSMFILLFALGFVFITQSHP